MEKQKGKSKLFNVRLSASQYEALNKIRKDHGMSIAQLFRDTIPFLENFYKSEKPTGTGKKGE
ncbi:MAG: hypothetical protein ACOYLO_15495 [Ferruginibacter sp.]